MIDNIMFCSMLDELTKIASRWREAKRLAQLGPGDVKRLEQSGLLDYGKEVAGLNRGSRNIMKRLGLEETAAPGEFGMIHYNPLSKKIHLDPDDIQDLPGMSGLPKDQLGAAEAVVRRHEVDEARAYDRLQKSLGGKNVFDPDELASLTPKEMDHLTAGRFTSHMSPEVVAKEQRNRAFMPSGAEKALTSMRNEALPEDKIVRSIAGKTGPGALSRADVKKVDKGWRKNQADIIAPILDEL